jgi:hypothetical protein
MPRDLIARTARENADGAIATDERANDFHRSAVTAEREDTLIRIRQRAGDARGMTGCLCEHDIDGDAGIAKSGDGDTFARGTAARCGVHDQER